MNDNVSHSGGHRKGKIDIFSGESGVRSLQLGSYLTDDDEVVENGIDELLV